MLADQIRAQHIVCAALTTFASSFAPAMGADISRRVSDRVRRATVMVLMEIPGTNQGGSGTGEFINSNGLLITNNHVVDPNHGLSREERAKNFHKLTLPKYRVIVESGTKREKTYDAELLYQSEPTDLALLQLKPDNKRKTPRPPAYLRLVPEDALKEGLKVWVFGFPGGLRRGSDIAVTFGLITELTRSRSGLIHYVETDATVHPGNSGGPFVDVDGRLIGVATHKRFEEGKKDRSGAVPIGMVRDFIRNAFYEDRVPRTTDVLPFVDIFTDHNGIVLYPHYDRHETDCMVHSSGGDRIRRGSLNLEMIEARTRFGDVRVDLDRAAYLFVRNDISTLIMDGGDYITIATESFKFPFTFSGSDENVALKNIKLIAFPRRTKAVQFPQGDGVIVAGDGNRLGLSQIEGTVQIGTAKLKPANVASIERQKRGGQVLVARDGQRLPGRIGDDAFQARTIWSQDPIEVRFDTVTRATMRPIDWTYLNAKGRRLTDLIRFETDDLRNIASLLDSPDWPQAAPLLKQANKVKGRNRSAKRRLKLLQGVERVRRGDYSPARKSFRGLRSGDDQARWVAACYLRILDEREAGRLEENALSEPDAFWRASSYVAQSMLRDARERFEEAQQLDYDDNVRELHEIETELETANRLELGISQSLLMEVLRAEYEAHYYGYQELVEEYNRVVQIHNSQRSRFQQKGFDSKLKRINKKIERAIKEARRTYHNLAADVTGFVVEPPKFDKHRQ